jgi:hypothetical protein
LPAIQAEPIASQAIEVKQAEPEKKVRGTSRNIPMSLRFAVWNKHIGLEIAQTKCLCCRSNDIQQQRFECGHIVARANGGTIHIDNLMPICSMCNKSMQTRNLLEFREEYFGMRDIRGEAPGGVALIACDIPHRSLRSAVPLEGEIQTVSTTLASLSIA